MRSLPDCETVATLDLSCAHRASQVQAGACLHHFVTMEQPSIRKSPPSPTLPQATGTHPSSYDSVAAHVVSDSQGHDSVEVGQAATAKHSSAHRLGLKHHLASEVEIRRNLRKEVLPINQFTPSQAARQRLGACLARMNLGGSHFQRTDHLKGHLARGRCKKNNPQSQPDQKHPSTINYRFLSCGLTVIGG